jgi:tetratricopeptide (TPR) repeat protein
MCVVRLVQILICGATVLPASITLYAQPLKETVNEEVDVPESHAAAVSAYKKAMDETANNQWEDAIVDCSIAIKLAPEVPEFRRRRAWMFGHFGRYAEAIGDLSKVLEANPDDLHARISRADACELDGSYDKALSDFNEAIERHPTSIDALDERAKFYAREGDRDKALADRDRIIQLNPSRGYTLRASTHMLFEEYDQAILYASKALEIDESNWQALHAQACCYVEKLEPVKAAAIFQKALQVAPDSEFIYSGLASLHGNLAQYKEELADLLHADKLNRQRPTTKAELAEFFATCPRDDLRDAKKASQYIDEAIRLAPHEPWIWAPRAAVAAENGDFENAVRWQEICLQSKSLRKSELKEGKERLELYRAGKPARSKPTMPDKSLPATASATPAQPGK